MSFFALLKKDLKIVLADRRSLLINIMVPVALASFVGYIFAPRDKPASKITVGVVDLDGSKTSKKLVSAMENEQVLAAKPKNLQTAVSLLEEGKLAAVIVLPEGLGEKMGLKAFFTDTKPSIELLTDPSRSLDAQMINGILTKLVMQEVGRAFGDPVQGIADLKDAARAVDDMEASESEKAEWKAFFRAGISALETGRTSATRKTDRDSFQMPVDIKEKAVLRKGGEFNSYSHSFAGMMVMYILFVAIQGGTFVIDERKRGTWRRLQSAPVRRRDLLLSMTSTVCIQAIVTALAVYMFGWLVFNVKITGSIPGFFIMVLFSSLAVGGFALLLMGLGRTHSQVSGYGTFAVLLMSFLGGAWFPVWMMPNPLRSASMVMPTRWMMDGLHATTWRGLSIGSVGLPVLVLSAFTILFATVGLKVFSWDE